MSENAQASQNSFEITAGGNLENDNALLFLKHTVSLIVARALQSPVDVLQPFWVWGVNTLFPLQEFVLGPGTFRHQEQMRNVNAKAGIIRTWRGHIVYGLLCIYCPTDSLEDLTHSLALQWYNLASTFSKERPSLSLPAVSTWITWLFTARLKDVEWQLQSPHGNSSPAGCYSAESLPQTAPCQSAAMITSRGVHLRRCLESALVFTTARSAVTAEGFQKQRHLGWVCGGGAGTGRGILSRKWGWK